jgi:hypothetical protein
VKVRNTRYVADDSYPNPIRGGNGGGSMGMGMGSVYGPGPVAAAASVLIPPSPGGQAGTTFFKSDHDGILWADG